MRLVLFIVSLLILPLNSYSQQEELPYLEAHFTAFIVNDIDTSIRWYSNNFGFKTIDKKEYPDSGFKQANLKRGNTLIELIELNTAVNPSDVIPDYHSKTRLIGFFKVGFLIEDFEAFKDHLVKNKVDFHGKVVKNEESGKRMVIVKDPDGNRIQLFEK